jgi:hypothetical protein
VGVRVVGNYILGFALFWILGMAAELLGNFVSRDGSVVGWAGFALHIILMTVVVYWAIKRKARGFVPGVVIAVVVFAVELIWTMRGSGHS